jgi:NitT/TauT family transport system ATP-binding protein
MAGARIDELGSPEKPRFLAGRVTAQPLSLDAREITVEFPNPRKGVSIVACWKLSLAVAQGEFVSIIGPSGCGKTTFLNVLGGLQEPTSGELYVNGKKVTKPGRERMIVFQEYGLLPWRTVESNVRLGLELRHTRKSEADAAVAKALELVGLTPFAGAYSYELSGGMKQRAGLARALVTDPEILLLDEPFGALDAMTREVLQHEFEGIFMKTRKTAILITHSIDEAIALSDRIIVCTARPSRFKGEVVVDLPRPRVGFDIKAEPRYSEIYEEVWRLVESEIHDDRELRSESAQ